MPACVMDVVYGYDRVVVEGQSGVLDFLMTESSCLCSKIQFLSSVQAKERAGRIVQPPFNNVLFQCKYYPT